MATNYDALDLVMDLKSSDEIFWSGTVRLSRKTYDQLQEVAEYTGKKPAQIMRHVLERQIEGMYDAILNLDVEHPDVDKTVKR